MIETDAIVSLRNLGKRFIKRRDWSELLRRPFATEHVIALSEVSIDIRKGEFFGLLGQNGAGKTTLFKTLAGLVIPDYGSATVAGLDVVRDVSEVQKVLTPVIPEERSLFWRISATENLRLFAALHGLHRKSADVRVRQVLEIVGLEDAGKKIVGAFSSGMKQRLLIGRALLDTPQVLLLDEPTRSLDPLAARDFRKFLRQTLVDEQGCTVLLATHNADEAINLCDRVGILHRGRLLAAGSVDELMETVGHVTYQLISREDVSLQLQQAVDVRALSKFSLAPDAGDAWNRYTLYVAGGMQDASDILTMLVSGGAQIAVFEREDLALADLLEKILTGTENA